VAIRNDKTILFTLLILLFIFVVIITSALVLLVDVFAILLRPLILTVHVIVYQILVFSEGVPTGDDSAFLIKLAIILLEGVFNNDAFDSSSRWVLHLGPELIVKSDKGLHGLYEQVFGVDGAVVDHGVPCA